MMFPYTLKGCEFIREQDPLKQGLKHFRTIKRIEKRKIREQDPLKQGLKHVFHYGSYTVRLFVSKIH